jgi:hypothetical protein
MFLGVSLGVSPLRSLSDHGGSLGPVEGGSGVIYNNVQATNGGAA